MNLVDPTGHIAVHLILIGVAVIAVAAVGLAIIYSSPQAQESAANVAESLTVAIDDIPTSQEIINNNPALRLMQLAEIEALSRVGVQIKPGTSGGPTAGKVFPEKVKERVRQEDPTATCVWCLRPGTGTDVDHAIPRSLEGDATPENGQLACPHCNRSRGNGPTPKSPPKDYTGPWPPPHWPKAE